mmetsp:Transcript_7823/g.18064  ORF Transcript_7823/g.18064 Transcript_7823/m.18064 type:complete len:339 (-) Transcript_7823:284-1300(-)
MQSTRSQSTTTSTTTSVPRSQMEAGIEPDRKGVLSICKLVRLLKSSIVGGTDPERFVLLRDRTARRASKPNSAGILPPISSPLSTSVSIFVNRLISEGIVPTNALFETRSSVNPVSCPTSEEIEPETPEEPTQNLFSFSNPYNPTGIDPPISVPSRINSSKFDINPTSLGISPMIGQNRTSKSIKLDILPNSDGIVPLTERPCKTKPSKLVNKPNSEGRGPSIPDSRISNIRRRDNLPKSEGIVPSIRLRSIRNSSNFVNWPISVGNDPSSVLLPSLPRRSISRFPACPISLGIDPVMAVSERSRSFSFVMFRISEGRLPVMLLFERSNRTRFPNDQN